MLMRLILYCLCLFFLFSLVKRSLFRFVKIDEVTSEHESLRGLTENASKVGSEDAIPKCAPKNHIFYLKMHKCASSSLQNIFLRYGYTRNLIFALPTTLNYLGNPEPFQASMMPESLTPRSGKVDIFTVHTRLNIEEHKKVMPPDTIYITSVRDPITMLESIFNYFYLKKFYKTDFPGFVLNWNLTDQLNFMRPFGKFGPNNMLFDLGHDVHGGMKSLGVKEAIDSADKLFDLVLVAEKIDEGLILMKELLCWDYEDIIFFTKNARREDAKSVTITPQMAERLALIQSADMLVYNHFLAKHNQAVLKYGEEKMANEIQILQSMREKMFKDCEVKIVKEVDKSETIFKETMNTVNSYVVKPDASLTCLSLTLPEFPLLERIRSKQVKLLQANQA